MINYDFVWSTQCSRNVLQKNALDLDYNVLASAYNVLEFPINISLLNPSCFFNLFFFARTIVACDSFYQFSFQNTTPSQRRQGQGQHRELKRGVYCR